LPTPPDDQPAELASLVRFYAHPIRALLRERAGLRLRSDEERAAEQIPITFTGLDRWSVGDRLLRRHLSGQELQQLTAAEWRRGWLPPRSLGSAAITEVADTVRELKATAASHLTETASRYDVSIQIGETVLAGTVPKVHGSTIVRVTYSFLSAKQRLQTWIELLALTAGLPGHEWRAAVIGRGGSSILGPVEQELARNLLTDLAELRRTGLCEPLPFSPKTSAEYARIRVDGKTVELYAKKLEAIWLTERDREYESFFGPRAGLAELMRQPSLTNEERAGTAEPSRFGTLARRIYEPLLAAETTR
jgi:exodeoxyribonuclease V gamma subunit